MKYDILHKVIVFNWIPTNETIGNLVESECHLSKQESETDDGDFGNKETSDQQAPEEEQVVHEIIDVASDDQSSSSSDDGEEDKVENADAVEADNNLMLI